MSSTPVEQFSAQSMTFPNAVVSGLLVIREQSERLGEPWQITSAMPTSRY
jgi:hypothetical protein